MITQLYYDWYATPEQGEDYSQAIVGKNNVVSIEKKLPSCDGDKLHFLITKSTGVTIEVYNPSRVVYNENNHTF